MVEGTALCQVDEEETQTWTPVVVRILDANSSSKERVLFLHETSIYRCSSHPNVLKLLGRSLDTIPLLLLQEYCPLGDVKKYLRNQQNPQQFAKSDYPLLWSCQLSSGLKHLHDNGLIHLDLSARNCVLTHDLILKIGDYGLSVRNYPEDYYLGVQGVSVRWCAPESVLYTPTTIQPKQITMESNIWSLAVTMWEICTCGEQPYSNLTDDEVISQVLGPAHVRLPQPSIHVYYTDYIYRLMLHCWSSAESRPSISQVDLTLTDLLRVHKNTKVDDATPQIPDFDERYSNLLIYSKAYML